MPVRARQDFRFVEHELVRALLAIQRRLDGWRLHEAELEQGFTFTFTKGDRVLLVELERRSDEAACYARTPHFNVYYSLICRDRPDLDASEQAVLRLIVSVVTRADARLPWVQRPAVHRRMAVREIEVKRVLMREPNGAYYLNPYVGCTLGCPFCYAMDRIDFSREMEGLPRLPWGRYVDAKVNAPEVLAEEILRLPPGPVRISPIATDPYQPLERHYRLTRRCLEVFRGTRFNPGVLTRSSSVLEDLDLIVSLDRSSVSLTIPTDDDRMREVFEPGTEPIERRIETARRLHEAGVPVYLVAQPLLPLDPERFVRLLGPLVRLVRIDRMYVQERVRATYEAHGLAHCLDDAWFTDMHARLMAGFAAYGVRESLFDDLTELVGDVPE